MHWLVANAGRYDLVIIVGDLLDLGSALDFEVQIVVVHNAPFYPPYASLRNDSARCLFVSSKEARADSDPLIVVSFRNQLYHK
jgi:hypothetical protein